MNGQPHSLHLCRDDASAVLCRAVVSGPLSEQQDGPNWVMVWPAGTTVETGDGRTFHNTRPETVLAAFEATGQDLMFDISHRSELSEDEPPAQGWVDALEVRDGAIWARVSWTDIGRELLARRHYRYVSPSFLTDKAGTLRAFTSFALVNKPAFDMPALARSETTTPENDKTTTESIMNEEELAQLRAKLGLPEDASVADILAAATKAEAEAKVEEEPANKDGQGKPGSDPADTDKRAENPVSLTDYVPRADYDALAARNVELESQVAAPSDAEVEALLDRAVETARIAPASRDHYKQLCRSQAGFEDVKALVGSARPVVNTKSDPELARRKGGPQASFDEQAAHVCRLLGADPDTFAKELEADHA